MSNKLHGARFLKSETDPQLLPESRAEVTFVGRSNVGKSALICALCENGKLARVSKTPGRTQSINLFEVRPDIWLVDLPGYGYAAAPERTREYWPRMIGDYITGRSTLSVVYILIELELGVGPIDLSFIHWLSKAKIPFKLVGTKSDKLGRQKQNEKRAALAASIGLEPKDVFMVSSTKNYGLNELARDVEANLGI